MKNIMALVFAAAALTACAQNAPSPQDQFMDNLKTLCGKAFEGKVVSDEAVDADWRKETLVIYVNDCGASEVKIPLHVGANRSRTWIISKTETGLRLKHDHRHEDGSPDAVTFYGGDTDSAGTALEQSFPVDAESIALFKKEGLEASIVNVWTVSIKPGERLTYILSRPNRHFQADFDLTKPIDAPPPAWGYEK